MLSIVLSNQVPKPWTFNIVQLMFENKKKISLSLGNWVIIFPIFLFFQFFHIFYDEHILFLSVCYVLQKDVEKSIRLSQQPSSLLIQFQIYGSGRTPKLPEIWQTANSVQLYYLPQCELHHTEQHWSLQMKPSDQRGIHFPNWITKSKLWYA